MLCEYNANNIQVKSAMVKDCSIKCDRSKQVCELIGQYSGYSLYKSKRITLGTFALTNP